MRARSTRPRTIITHDSGYPAWTTWRRTNVEHHAAWLPGLGQQARRSAPSLGARARCEGGPAGASCVGLRVRRRGVRAVRASSLRTAVAPTRSPWLVHPAETNSEMTGYGEPPAGRPRSGFGLKDAVPAGTRRSAAPWARSPLASPALNEVAASIRQGIDRARGQGRWSSLEFNHGAHCGHRHRGPPACSGA